MNNFILGVGGNSTSVLLKDGANGRIIRELPFPEGEVRRVVFSGIGPISATEPLYLAAGGALGRVRVFDVSEKVAPTNKFAPYNGHRGEVTAIGFEPKHTSFAYSASEDGTVQVWRPILTNAALPGAGSRNLSSVGSGAPSGNVAPRSVNGNGKSVTSQPFHGLFTPTKFENWGPSCLVAVHDAVYYPPKDLFFSVDAVGRLCIWDHVAKKKQAELVPHRSRRSIRCMELSTDYRLLLLANNDGFIFVYDVKNMISDSRAVKPLCFRGSSSYVTRLRLSSSTNLLVCTTRDDGVKVFRMMDVMTYSVPEASLPDLTHESLTPHRAYSGRQGWIWDAAFVGNMEDYFFTCNSNKEITLWNLNNAIHTCTYRDLKWPVLTMAVKERVEEISTLQTVLNVNPAMHG